MTFSPRERSPLELWGGVECTVNRVGDASFDQLERTGHATRLDDLDRFADLGIRALRYPILWERTAPDGLDHADWRWADKRLGKLRDLGVRPIVGLVHHGSGPRQTSLIDPAFADGLAAFARTVAERYPWVEDWTPVNEPLTTARFSGLYGHWYPHGRDDRTCARALINQCRATVAAMRAIRAVNPTARLIQTEDLGKVFSTPALRYQADFENERRWLSLDLLCGRVDRRHPLWGYLRWAGIPAAELESFLADPCPPDVLGVNHYVTSERFLDERLERYPPHTHGGNGRQAYADVEAVRVLADGPAGPELLLRETWERYRRPLAVTEVHLGCTGEEQVRWFAEVWDAACHLRDAGVDVRAVTAWSLLGAYDWDSLLTRADGRYEPGVFDLRAPHPRATVLAGLVRDLAAGRGPDHPLLATPGWWRRPERLSYPPIRLRDGPSAPDRWRRAPRDRPAPPVLIVDAVDGLGAAFARACAARAIAHRVVGQDEIDGNALSGVAAIAVVGGTDRPWAVIDARSPTLLANAVEAGESRLAAVVAGSTAFAAACAQHRLPLVAFSSDLVFDGTLTRPYVEGDPISAVDPLGRATARLETRVLAAHPGALMVRTGPRFGPGDAADTLAAALRALADGEPVAASATIVSPTYVPDLVHACLDLLVDGEQGIWHLANTGEGIAWGDRLRRTVDLGGRDPGMVGAGVPAAAPPTGPVPARRLASERGWSMPPLGDALARFARGRATASPEPTAATELASLGAARRAECWTDDVAARRAS